MNLKSKYHVAEITLSSDDLQGQINFKFPEYCKKIVGYKTSIHDPEKGILNREVGYVAVSTDTNKKNFIEDIVIPNTISGMGFTTVDVDISENKNVTAIFMLSDNVMLNRDFVVKITFKTEI